MTLASQLASAQRRLQELTSEAETALSRHQAQAREEAAVLRVKLEQAQGRRGEEEAIRGSMGECDLRGVIPGAKQTYYL